MVMIRMPVDAVWVRRLAELADGPWTEEAVTAAFAQSGWTGALFQDSDGRLVLPWLSGADLISPDGEISSGWMMHFGEYPPLEDDPDGEVDLHSGLELDCARFWPPRGKDDDGTFDRGSMERDELLQAAEERADCIADQQARRADFVAEFDRIYALVRELLGTPDKIIRGECVKVHAVWERGVMVLVLVMEPCARDYNASDWIALRVAPVQSVGESDTAWS